MKSGLYLDKGDITFEKFTQIWFEDYALIKLEPKTRERYMTLLVRINAEIGGLKLSKIEPLHIIRLMNSLAEGGARSDDKYILRGEYIPLLKENKKMLCEIVNERTVANISKLRATNEKTAIKIANVFEMKVLTLFNAENPKSKLSQQPLSVAGIK